MSSLATHSFKWDFLNKSIHVAPLAIFRVLFGAIMFISIVRFAAKGWIYDLYVAPKMFFPYYGFEWAKPMGEVGMYVIFVVMGLSFLAMSLGAFYRIASITAFLSFTYVELIDKTNYLNHYYFVSIICFLLLFVPAHRYFSLDVLRKPTIKITHIPRWMIGIFKLQLFIVYFYAGLAKLNADWLLDAMPLKIWLPAKSHLPIIGNYLQLTWVAYAFSWLGALYDLSIPFLLLNKKTRPVAFAAVIGFHGMTAILFPIGMFPYIMILSTIIFFSSNFHIKLMNIFKNLRFKIYDLQFKTNPQISTFNLKLQTSNLKLYMLTIFFIIQLLMPWRFVLYPNNLFWSEQGYRFSWRVMLMEKAGYVTFHVKDNNTGKQWDINNYEYLTTHQEKMMSTQPDMIVQFAHYIQDHYERLGYTNTAIYADAYVSLNGQKSQLFLDNALDLTEVEDGFKHKNWILPYPKIAQGN